MFLRRISKAGTVSTLELGRRAITDSDIYSTISRYYSEQSKTILTLSNQVGETCKIGGYMLIMSFPISWFDNTKFPQSIKRLDFRYFI